MSAYPSVIPKELFEYINSAKEACRYLRLPHPRTGLPSLFLPYVQDTKPEESNPNGEIILELQSIAPDSRRSWFLSEGEVLSDGRLLVLTPVDPAFLLLPLLEALTAKRDQTARFLPAEDLFEAATSALAAIHASDDSVQGPPAALVERDIMELAKLDCVRKALHQVCDVKELTHDLHVFRFSRARTLELLRKKVINIGCPATFDHFPSLQRMLARDGLAASEEGPAITPALRQEARVKASCELVSQYISPALKEELLGSFEFSLLDSHLKVLELEASCLVTATAASRPNNANVDANGKKRKAVNQASRGVEKLKKVNVSKMAKLSTFFTKKV